MYPYVQILGTTVSVYTILVLVGFGLGVLAALLRRRINDVSITDLLTCMLIGGAGALVGGKLFYMIQGLPQFLQLAQNSGYTFLQYFQDAGLVYYGGFVGAVLFLLLAAKLTGAPIWPVIDTVLPSIPLMQAFGRLGCLSAGCCYGVPSDFGFYFDTSPFAPHGIRLFPVQLAESVCVAILFAALVFYGRKKRIPGRVLAFYLIAYGIIRFILEFFRYDSVRGIYAGLSVSQWISIAFIALGFFFRYGYPVFHKVRAAKT